MKDPEKYNHLIENGFCKFENIVTLSSNRLIQFSRNR